jgi:ABC-type Fe3+-hydroxamate transport system substrate-binding protein
LHTYEKVGNETVLRWTPDWVFSWAEPDLHDEELQRWRSDPALGAVAAVEKNQLIVRDGKEVLSLSQHATTLAHIMADAICK